MTGGVVGPRREVSGSLLFRSKLRPPHAERLLARPRLLELLNASVSVPLTVVVAPAGAGKTSLAASWVAASDRPAAWLTVDENDQDLVQLWTGLISALETVVVGGLSTVSLQPQRPGELDTTAARLLAELETRPSPPCTLVIDDVHLLDANPDAVSSLSVFLRHLPTWLHVVLLARRAPQLPLARLRARGELLDVGPRELLFSTDEAEELMGALAPGLDAIDAEAVVARVGGWAAGIQLAALAARRSRIDPTLDPREEENVLLSDYVWQEVLEGESVALVNVLLELSVVERVCPDLAERLTGLSDAGRLLSAAESRGLFVARLGSSDWFQIHALVRDRLRAELTRRSASRMADLHARAAAWFEDHGEVAVALDHWLLAGNPGEAFRLLTAKTMALYNAGQETTIARTVARLSAMDPPEDAERSIDLAWCVLFVDRAEFLREVDRATECVARCAEVGRDLRGRLTLLHSMAATVRGDWSTGGRLARKAMGDLGVGWRSDVLGRFGWNMIARDIALSENWHDSADARTVQHELSGDAERRLAFEGTRALGEALAGHPLDALRVAAGVRGAATTANMSILRLELSAAEAIAHRELSEHDRAMAELQDLASAHLGPITYTGMLAHLQLTELYLDDGRPVEAEVAFTRATRLVEGDFGGTGGRDWLGRVGTRLALSNEDLNQARRWAGSIADPFWGPLCRARIQLATGDTREALELLDRARARCVRHSVVRGLVRAAALRSHGDAVEQAGAAAEQASAAGLIQTVASEGPDCVGLVELGAWRVPEAWLDLVRRAPNGTRPVQVRTRGLLETLTERETEVLRLLPSRLTLHEVADELFISMNTLKFHLKVIYRKLDCGSRAEAAEMARQMVRPRGGTRSAMSQH